MPQRANSPRTLYKNWPVDADITDRAHMRAQKFCANLHRFMDNNNLSQADVARRCGLSDRTVSDVLLGNVWPTAETIARLEVGLTIRLWP